MSDEHPAKQIQDALMNSFTNGAMGSLSGAADLMSEMQAILKSAIPADMELPPEMVALIEKTAQMEALAHEIAEKEASGDTEAMATLTEEFAALSGGPEYDDEPLPSEAKAVFDAIADADIAALHAVLPLIDLNQGYGKYQKTPLYDAIAGVDPSPAVVNLLLGAGADPQLGLIGDSTPLHGAAFTYFRDWTLDDLVAVVRRFVAGGANIEARTASYGWTPLHSAIMERNVELLEALLICGADPQARFAPHSMPEFTRGMMPIHAAEYHPDILTLLFAHGADPDAVDGMGQTLDEMITSKLQSDPECYGRAELEASLAVVRSQKN